MIRWALTLTLTVGLAFAAAPAEASLVAFWDFDNDSAAASDINDQSGNSRDGSVKSVGSGSASFGGDVPAEISSRSIASLDLSSNPAGGTANVAWVDIDSPDYKGVLGKGPRTVSLWMKTSSSDDQGIIQWGSVSAGNLWSLRMDEIGGSGDYSVRAEVHSGGVGATTPLDDGLWHHVAVVLPDLVAPDALDITVFIDGEQETLTQTSGEPIDTTTGYNVLIGREFAFNKGALDGLFDEVAIYDRALPSGLIRQLAAGVSPALIPEPGTWLIAVGLGAFGAILLRRRRGAPR